MSTNPAAASDSEKAKVINPVDRVTVEQLEKEFSSYDGEAPDQLPSLIPNVLPEGVTFFGAPAGTTKTWVGISVAKSLVTGTLLCGIFNVPQPVAVLYLIPEASDGSFKRRLKKMRFPANHPMFRYRTVSKGETLPLQHPKILAMVKHLREKFGKVLVIVDTAIRFLAAKDENSATQNNLNRDSEVLRFYGASVLFMHHSPKNLSKRPRGKGSYEQKLLDSMTTESVLRGTSDFSAMPDAVYGFLRDDILYDNGNGPEEVLVKCIKPRDLDTPPTPFRLVLRYGPGDSAIDKTGDLAYRILRTAEDKKKALDLYVKTAETLVAAVKADSKISRNALAEKFHLGKDKVVPILKEQGWVLKGKGKNKEWVCTSFIKTR